MYFLINNGAEIEAKDMAGRTPLFLAVKNGNNDNIDILNVSIIFSIFLFFLLIFKKSYYLQMEQILMHFPMARNLLHNIQKI